MSRDHKAGIIRAMKNFSDRNRRKMFSCDCGEKFFEKKSLFGHKRRKECFATTDELDWPAKQQLSLFGRMG